ncbi:MAG: hypothetical protein V5A85_08690 [Haloarculaceae archaeon]
MNWAGAALLASVFALWGGAYVRYPEAVYRYRNGVSAFPGDEHGERIRRRYGRTGLFVLLVGALVTLVALTR